MFHTLCVDTVESNHHHYRYALALARTSTHTHAHARTSKPVPARGVCAGIAANAGDFGRPRSATTTFNIGQGVVEAPRAQWVRAARAFGAIASRKQNQLKSVQGALELQNEARRVSDSVQAERE